MDLFNKEVEYYEELSCQQKHRWLEYRLNYLFGMGDLGRGILRMICL